MASTYEGAVERRRLILRDSLGLLTLMLATAALFAVTWFLFRSFSAHRADLAKRWAARGRAAVQDGKPDEAITALRAALVYAPGTRDYELLLAEALGQTGKPEQAAESYQYFMSLWAAEPGSGPINLELARLARKQDRPRDAINFYRAAIYGTWEGDGVERRYAARVELAQYLVDQHDLQTARMELLIAGGNAPENYTRDMQIAALLEQAGDMDNAELYYRNALKTKPRAKTERDNARAAIARIDAQRSAEQAAAAAATAAQGDQGDEGSTAQKSQGLKPSRSGTRAARNSTGKTGAKASAPQRGSR